MKAKSKAKILVIEDDEADWLLMSKAFQQCLAELSFVRAASAGELLQLLDHWQNQEWELPNLILQDLSLPTHQQGFDVLRQLKAPESSCRYIPVVLMSRSAQSVEIETAYRLGTSSYVVKPTLFTEWITLLGELRTYWLEVVTLPPLRFG